jgi:hypothetical protein
MERYWMTEAPTPKGAWGLVRVEEARELRFGSAYAKGTELLALPNDRTPASLIGEIVLTYAKDEVDPRWTQILTGLLWGYSTYLLPLLRQDYDIIGVEPEVPLLWPPSQPEMVWATRPDVVLRRRADATVWVPDNKTTKWKDARWLEKWPWAIQLHMQALAVKQQHPDLDVQGSLVLGAYKGYERESDWYTPFLIGYRTVTDGIPSYSARYVRGWEKFNPTRYFSMEDWVRMMPLDVLQENFPTSKPIFLREDVCQIVLEERLRREKQIAEWRLSSPEERLAARSTVFSHSTSSCNMCSYKEACWNPTVERDPCASGLFVPRTPNHTLEKAAFLEEQDDPS